MEFSNYVILNKIVRVWNIRALSELPLHLPLHIALSSASIIDGIIRSTVDTIIE